MPPSIRPRRSLGEGSTDRGSKSSSKQRYANRLLTCYSDKRGGLEGQIEQDQRLCKTTYAQSKRSEDVIVIIKNDKPAPKMTEEA